MVYSDFMVKPPLSRKRQRTRAALVEAALAIIAERGIAAVTLDEIAARAGVTKGAIYSNYRSKGELLWEAVDGPSEWIGTTLSWDLRREGDYTIVLFKHAGWNEPVEFMHHCSTKWAVFLLSMKERVETGKGRPFPDDMKIDDWN